MDLELRKAIRENDLETLNRWKLRSGVPPATPKQMEVAKVILRGLSHGSRHEVIAAFDAFGFTKTHNYQSGYPELGFGDGRYSYWIGPTCIYNLEMRRGVEKLTDKGIQVIPYDRVAERLRNWAKSIVVPCNAPGPGSTPNGPIPNCCRELEHEGGHHTWTRAGMSVSW